MTQLILLRHGESVWNRDNRFTGWTDVALSPRGERQAREAGEILRARGCELDVCFTSWLRRCTETLRIVLETMHVTDVPVRQSWQLNERHYGALQGLTRWQALRKFGPLAVLRCQVNFRSPPPPLPLGDARSPRGDPRYASVPPTELPRGESLLDTLERVRPFWQEEIVPALRQGQRALIVSHRNTLSVIVKLIEDVSELRASRIKIPTGRPLVYELDRALRPQARYYLRPRAGQEASVDAAEPRTAER